MMRETKHKISCQDICGWLLIGIGLIMLGNSLRLCFSKDIWYDELFTMGMVDHSYRELVRFTARDVHPPLYYCITKFIIDLCKLLVSQTEGVVIAKMVSVLPYFFLLVYALTFLRKRFGMLVSGVFFFCIIGMPQMSAYTVEVRMYSFALFFVTAAFLHAYEIVCDCHEKIHWAALTLYGLAAAYTQYFACVAIVMVYLYLLLHFAICHRADKKRALQNWCICVAASVVGYLPWLMVLISQITTVRENYWILPLTWRNLGGCVKFLMKPAFSLEKCNVILAVIFFLLYIGVLAAYGLRSRRQGKMEKFCYALAGCMVLGGLVAFGFVASVIIRPIFVYRYMLPAMGCFWFCFAVCLSALTEQEQTMKWQKAVRGIQLCALLFVTVIGIRNYRAFMGEEEYKIVQMQETEQVLEEIEPEDVVIYNFDQLQAVVGYYVNSENYLWGGTPETLIVAMFGEKGSVENTAQIKEWLEEGRKVWFFGSFNSRENIREEWEKDGIMTEEKGSYMLERYWFNIYEVSRKNMQ